MELTFCLLERILEIGSRGQCEECLISAYNQFGLNRAVKHKAILGYGDGKEGMAVLHFN